MVKRIIIFLSIVFLLHFICIPVYSGMSVKWEWSGGPSLPDHRSIKHTPIVVNLTDDNGDKVIDIHDIPDIVFAARQISGPDRWSALHAISGDDGHEIFTITDRSLSCDYSSNIAVGDIDGDNLPEIVGGHVISTAPWEGCPIAFENDGTFKWMGESSMLSNAILGAFSIEDLDHDGNPEIVMGSQVWDNKGFRKWNGKTFLGGPWLVSSCADINMDGMMEVVHCNTAYRWNGSVLWENLTLPYSGMTTIADFDRDGCPEIVLVGSDGDICMLNNNGSIRWGPYGVPGTGSSISPPVIEDFTGNKYPEIVVARQDKLTMFNRNGLIAWSIDIVDSTGAVSSPSAFDFEQDGLPEVVFNDTLNLMVIRGTDGKIMDSATHYSGTYYDNPVIADIDDDNNADIVVAASELYTWGGVSVFSSSAWPDARPIWNQFNYRIINVFDNGGIPLREPYSWLIFNNYRSQIRSFPMFPVPLFENNSFLLVLIIIMVFATLFKPID